MREIIETTITKSVRNSELNVTKNKRAFLTYPADGLIPCALEETEDEVKFNFDTFETEPASNILNEPKLQKYLFLINCASLEKLFCEYNFPLSLDNILIDISCSPRILTRDVQTAENADFTPIYKALIGSVLSRKYTYDDYLNGGADLYKKHKFLFELSSLESVKEIKNRLVKEYRLLQQRNIKTKKLVSKKSVVLSRIFIPFLSAILVVSSLFCLYTVFLNIPYKDAVIAANTAYINADYIGVQQELDNYELDKLNTDSKYILARSYVITEALTQAQKDNILVGLTPKTDPVIFDYWINLGRLNFSEAIDIAQRLGDDELLLFAYLKYEAFTRDDPTISGDEKVRLLSDLESKINSLQKTRDEALT